VIDEQMKLAAADALHALAQQRLSKDYIIPEPFDPQVRRAVASAVYNAAMNKLDE